MNHPLDRARLLASRLSATAFALLILCLLAAAAPVQALTRQTVESWSVPGKYSYGYLLYKPSSYGGDATKRWPLIVVLHGANQVGSNTEIVATVGLAQLIEQGRDFPAVVVSPQCPIAYWVPSRVAAFIADLTRLYLIDPSRVYVTGWSMGGFGTWQLAEAYPYRYAAIVPMCGGADPRLADRLRDLPVWAWHGALDSGISPDYSKNMDAAIRAAGGDPKLTLIPGYGHNISGYVCANEELYTWLFAQARSDVFSVTAQPQDRTVAVGGACSLDVEVSGGEVSYQWCKDGVPMPGRTSFQLTLADCQATDSGAYTVRVSNRTGTVTSRAAEVSVGGPD